MKVGDIVVYKPMWNIDVVYQITDVDLKEIGIGLYGDGNYVFMKDSSKAKWGATRFAHKSELQLANENEIARYIAELLTDDV